MRLILLSLLTITCPLLAEVREATVIRPLDQIPVKTFTLIHPSGISATVSNLGATLRSLSIPDRIGRINNILVGKKTESDWRKNSSYFGSTVGRYANRIADGEFTLDGTTYQLAKNNGTNHLHGGLIGFDRVLWSSEVTGENSVKLSYISPDGEEGYPGTLEVSVEYSIGKNSLIWKATATTNKATPVNLTNHAYFNLTGDPSASVLDHQLTINAEKYLPVSPTLIPTGEMRPVADTSFDFRKTVSIGEKLNTMEGSYDHNFILNQSAENSAILKDPESGRILVLKTNQRGMQFYLASPDGNKHSALCLEPQKFPDSPNQPDFPSSILRSGEIYRHEIAFHFPTPE